MKERRGIVSQSPCGHRRGIEAGYGKGEGTAPSVPYPNNPLTLVAAVGTLINPQLGLSHPGERFLCWGRGRYSPLRSHGQHPTNPRCYRTLFDQSTRAPDPSGFFGGLYGKVLPTACCVPMANNPLTLVCYRTLFKQSTTGPDPCGFARRVIWKGAWYSP